MRDFVEFTYKDDTSLCLRYEEILGFSQDFEKEHWTLVMTRSQSTNHDGTGTGYLVKESFLEVKRMLQEYCQNQQDFQQYQAFMKMKDKING